MSSKNKRILVITSCSAKKRSGSEPIKAIKLYNGGFFNQVKKFVKVHKFDLKIISAKYGLLSTEEIITEYNIRIKNNDDILKLQEKVIPKLKEIISNYDKILIFMGENYRKVIEPIKDERFLYFFDKRGLGGYKSLMTHLLKMYNKDLVKLLVQDKYKVITIDIIKEIFHNFHISIKCKE